MTSRRAWIAGMVGMALASPAAIGVSRWPPSRAGPEPPREESPPHSGAGGAAAAPAGAAAAPQTLFGFFGLSKANLAACRDRLCASQIGQMANSLATGPVARFPGASSRRSVRRRPVPLRSPTCPAAPVERRRSPARSWRARPTPSAGRGRRIPRHRRLLALAGGHQGITERPAGRSQRVRAIRGRRALNSGCCCSKEIIDSLTVCVSGRGGWQSARELAAGEVGGLLRPAELSDAGSAGAPADTTNPPVAPLEPETTPALPPAIPLTPMTPERSSTSTESPAPTHLAAARLSARST